MNKNLLHLIDNNWDELEEKVHTLSKYLKDKSYIVEKTAYKHVKDNPFKSIGIAALSGFLLAKIIS